MRAVQRLRVPPLLWVVGHIHEQYGQYCLRHEATGKHIRVVNAAVAHLAKGYNDTRPVVLELPSGRLEQPAVPPCSSSSEGDGKPEYI